jgi:hypothetical protein
MPAVAEIRGWRWLAATCLVRWHLCSLDAPTVAVVWAIMLARLAGTRLRWAEVGVLGLGTWIVYVLDRVLDGVGAEVRDRPVEETHLKERHYFHRRHRKVMLWLCGMAAVWVMVLCGRLPARLVGFYMALAVPVLAYGVRVHWRLMGGVRARRADGQRGKEAAVGLLFTAAVAAPALTGARDGSRSALLVISCLLAGLCWLNCGVISFSEAGDHLYGRDFHGQEFHGQAGRREWLEIAGWALALAFVAAAVCGWGLGWSPGARSSPAAASILLSCLLLLRLLLGRRDGRMSARRVRVLADVGLLTPLLFLIGRS